MDDNDESLSVREYLDAIQEIEKHADLGSVGSVADYLIGYTAALLSAEQRSEAASAARRKFTRGDE